MKFGASNHCFFFSFDLLCFSQTVAQINYCVRVWSFFRLRFHEKTTVVYHLPKVKG